MAKNSGKKTEEDEKKIACLKNNAIGIEPWPQYFGAFGIGRIKREKPNAALAGNLPQTESKTASKSEKPIEPPPGLIPHAESKEASKAENPIPQAES